LFVKIEICRLWTPIERIKLENVFDTRAIYKT